MATIRLFPILLTAIVVSSLAQQSTPADEQRIANWREDLRFLESHYSARGESIDMLRGISSRGQKDFEKLYPTFNSSIAELESDLPRLSDGNSCCAR